MFARIILYKSEKVFLFRKKSCKIRRNFKNLIKNCEDVKTIMKILGNFNKI